MTRILSAFTEIPLPPAPLHVQPPEGETLVNFETVFYTESEPFTRSRSLLGQRVEFRIRAASFTWKFGDGEDLTTLTPGKPFSSLENLDENITHNYLQKGTYRPSLSTTYTADYRVGTGPWQPVPGTVTIDGPAEDLVALEARPVLVD